MAKRRRRRRALYKRRPKSYVKARGRFTRRKRTSMRFIRSQGFKTRRAYEKAIRNLARANDAFDRTVAKYEREQHAKGLRWNGSAWVKR